jgi:hypothetical protein
MPEDREGSIVCTNDLSFDDIIIKDLIINNPLGI